MNGKRHPPTLLHGTTAGEGDPYVSAGFLPPSDSDSDLEDIDNDAESGPSGASLGVADDQAAARHGTLVLHHMVIQLTTDVQSKGCAVVCRSSHSADEGPSEAGAELPALLCKKLLIGKDHPDNPINTGKSVYNESRDH